MLGIKIEVIRPYFKRMRIGAKSRVLISIATMAAIAIAIIVGSLAWFSANGSNNVTTSALELNASTVSNMIIDTEALQEYGRYMGQTGTEYDGYDAPYYLTYSPFTVDISNLDLDQYGPYFYYNLSSLSRIDFIFSNERISTLCSVCVHPPPAYAVEASFRPHR